MTKAANSIKGSAPNGTAHLAIPKWGRLAQLVEQLTLNQRVVGSNPSASTIFQWCRDIPVCGAVVKVTLRRVSDGFLHCLVPNRKADSPLLGMTALYLDAAIIVMREI